MTDEKKLNPVESKLSNKLPELSKESSFKFDPKMMSVGVYPTEEPVVFLMPPSTGKSMPLEMEQFAKYNLKDVCRYVNPFEGSYPITKGEWGEATPIEKEWTPKNEKPHTPPSRLLVGLLNRAIPKPKKETPMGFDLSRYEDMP